MSKGVRETVVVPSRLRLSRWTGRKASQSSGSIGATQLSVMPENRRSQRFGRRDNKDLNMSVFIIARSVSRTSRFSTCTDSTNLDNGGSSKELLFLTVINVRNGRN